MKYDITQAESREATEEVIQEQLSVIKRGGFYNVSLYMLFSGDWYFIIAYPNNNDAMVLSKFLAVLGLSFIVYLLFINYDHMKEAKSIIESIKDDHE